MKGRTRHFVAITLVATALCADRALAAAPAFQPQVASAAGKLVSRLSVSLRRVVPSAQVYEFRHDDLADSVATSVCVSDTAPRFNTRLSALMLHLPPPAL